MAGVASLNIYSAKLPMKLFSIYKMGANKPEYTEVTKEKKKGKNAHHQHTRLRREKKQSGHPSI
jgi:hypothetical protein